MKPLRTLIVPALALALVPVATAAEIPARPEQLTYGPLDFEVPRAEGLRHELPGGIVVYVVEDHALPLVNVVLNVRTGSFREPAGKPGLSDLTAALMRLGGTRSLTPEEFDERADFLAANVSASSGDTGSQASLNVLSTSLGDGLDLLFDMLREPRFDADRLATEKSKALEAMKQRNDDAGDILAREWDWIRNGRDHFSSRRATAAELESISRDDLVAFHARTWGPEGMVVAVSGDVDTETILAELGRRLEGWSAGEPAPWPPEGPEHEVVPGLYHVEKDIPQGKVVIGHPTFQVEDWSDPEIYSIQVMNDILGGGGFTSRLLKRVRSDEGLAYGANSRFTFGSYWPGTFTMSYASKNPTVAYAMKIALEELERIRTEPVSEDELRVSKSSFIEAFPRSFESAAQVAGTFVQDEILGRPHEYWYGYRDRIRAVTAEQVLEVARKDLHPDRLATLIVGKWDEIAPGDPDGHATMSELGGDQVVHLPPRDPLTLDPLP